MHLQRNQWIVIKIKQTVKEIDTTIFAITGWMFAIERPTCPKPRIKIATTLTVQFTEGIDSFVVSVAETKNFWEHTIKKAILIGPLSRGHTIPHKLEQQIETIEKRFRFKDAKIVEIVKITKEYIRMWSGHSWGTGTQVEELMWREEG